jgi:hypothetical protein
MILENQSRISFENLKNKLIKEFQVKKDQLDINFTTKEDKGTMGESFSIVSYSDIHTLFFMERDRIIKHDSLSPLLVDELATMLNELKEGEPNENY